MSPSLSVCVFCGSRPGNRPSYMEAARQTGEMIARRGWRLVYGAGDVGLMGEVARGAADGDTLGVIPQHLMIREQGRRAVSQFIVTDNMHVRKTVMYMNSDRIVVLPGGAGSLDEFFEVLTWRQIGLHDKPIYLLNTDGYWEPLMQLLKHSVSEGFADASLLDFVTVVADVATLEEELAR
ncbi:TIGR00730 family Rossman fold protein [Falsirhodobacter algicola]|uniref:Cytokinin riboside 5'-monophosphate phosphoribohydrolase n=1 Tax=Falsirhodobacter algicola TaxID=2692330 RepID=A0A8J8SKI6_9RHOB|nr:TIGR00730 family Rossman fold protein [Falsirhodobacter algicola]QUS35457.1 TIGR00730 family Rossman fold protein [Falsirhodobacter algicola]